MPIIALSQLNRSVEMRSGNKRPQLSDLRESGAIEQDADMVLFIHRPEKYGFIEDEEGNSLLGLAEIIIAKHRNGALADIKLRFRDELAKFVELEDDFIGVLPDEGNTEGAITLKSKMNDETSGDIDTEFPSNTNFDNETPF